MPASLEDLTTDQLLATARQLQGSHNLLQTLLNDPTSREMVQRQLKKANPALVIPEIDAKDSVLAELKVEREARIALERGILEDKVRGRMERERASVKAKYHLTDEDMTGVEALMTAETDSIPTYDAAARVFKASKVTATPTPSIINAPTYDMPEKDVWGKGIGNKAALDKIAINEAYAAFNDIRSGKVAGLGPASAN